MDTSSRYLQDCNVDYNVLVFTETWLSGDTESLFEIPGFPNISINRNENWRRGRELFSCE